MKGMAQVGVLGWNLGSTSCPCPWASCLTSLSLGFYTLEWE